MHRTSRVERASRVPPLERGRIYRPGTSVAMERLCCVIAGYPPSARRALGRQSVVRAPQWEPAPNRGFSPLSGKPCFREHETLRPFLAPDLGVGLGIGRGRYTASPPACPFRPLCSSFRPCRVPVLYRGIVRSLRPVPRYLARNRRIIASITRDDAPSGELWMFCVGDPITYPGTAAKLVRLS